MAVRFVLNGTAVDVAEGAPHTTLLQWLRAHGHCGTKEGCAEGECGACAVALVAKGRGDGGNRFEPVNSCLVPLLALDGREIVTVEGVAAADGALHPVQKAMVLAGGSQCGYCTPGFVVSLFCEYYRPDRTEYDPESISGNLCRCTGYRPIADVARALPAPAADDARLVQLKRRILAPASTQQSNFHRPSTLAEALALLQRYPQAVPIAGGTDLMVYANQRHQRWERLVSLEAVTELRRLEQAGDALVLGAGAPLSCIEHWLTELMPEGVAPGATLLGQLWPLFSSRLIKNRATLGGNLATASPIGDSAPALLALGAELDLVSARGVRRLPLAEFFAGYRKTVLAPGELIAAVRVPRPLPELQRFYKVSKRVLDDISTVAAGFALRLAADGTIASFGVGLGGVAATPLAAPSLDRLARGKPWNAATLALLVGEAQRLGSPQTDLRGSAEYRRAMLGKLLEKFFHETRAAEAAE